MEIRPVLILDLELSFINFRVGVVLQLKRIAI